MVASWKGMSNSGDRSPYNPAPDYVRINKLKAISNRVTKWIFCCHQNLVHCLKYIFFRREPTTNILLI